MTKLTRVTGKVFGGAATATTGGIGQFGSAATGTPNPTTDVATIQALQAYSVGWGSAVITSRNFPPIEEVTGVLKTISYQTCYNLQEGVAEYDINTEYSNTSIVKSVNNGIITFYASLTNNNIGNSLSDTDYWKPVVLDLDNKADVDLSNADPSQSFIDMAVSWGMPDYDDTAKISVSAASIAGSGGYTVNVNGYFNIPGTSSAAQNRDLKINGVKVWQVNYTSSGGDTGGGFICPVSPGDVLTGSTGSNCYIFTLKGGN